MIVIGDSLGDPEMASGLHSVECEIKIGFLNAKVCLSIACTISIDICGRF